MKRTPWLLYTYLLTEMLAPFFAALLVINAILFLGRLVPLLDGIFGLGVGLGDFARLCLYISPSLLRFSVPMAAMMAVIIAFTRMGNDLEIMALKASGIGLVKILPPVIFFGLITGLMTLGVATSLLPRGTVAMHQLMLHLATERIEQGVQEKAFSEGLGNVVLYVEEVSADDRGWRGVYLSDLRDPANPLTIAARSGALRAEPAKGLAILTLADGSLHRAVGDKTQTIHFQRYTLDLPLQPPAMGQLGRSSMTQPELLARAATLAPDHPQRLRLLIEYHQRLVLPLGCFLLSILGLSLSQIGQSSRLALGVPLGLASFIGYYVLLTVAKSLSENGQIPVVPAMWAPNLVFLLLTIHLLRRSALELGNPWLDRVIAGGRDTFARLRQWGGKTEP